MPLDVAAPVSSHSSISIATTTIHIESQLRGRIGTQPRALYAIDSALLSIAPRLLLIGNWLQRRACKFHVAAICCRYCVHNDCLFLSVFHWNWFLLCAHFSIFPFLFWFLHFCTHFNFDLPAGFPPAVTYADNTLRWFPPISITVYPW